MWLSHSDALLAIPCCHDDLVRLVDNISITSRRMPSILEHGIDSQSPTIQEGSFQRNVLRPLTQLVVSAHGFFPLALLFGSYPAQIISQILPETPLVLRSDVL